MDQSFTLLPEVNVCLCGSFCSYLISQHPEVDAKLAAELDKAGLLVTSERPMPRAMEYADLTRLTYLGWVCKVTTLAMPTVAAEPGNSYKGLHEDILR